jgi:Ribulose bisphosphate carboxylase, small chain
MPRPISLTSFRRRQSRDLIRHPSAPKGRCSSPPCGALPPTGRKAGRGDAGPITLQENSHARHSRLLFIPARPRRRRDSDPGSILPRQWVGVEHRVHRRPASPQHLLGDVGLPMFDLRDAEAVLMEVHACRKVFGERYIRLTPTIWGRFHDYSGNAEPLRKLCALFFCHCWIGCHGPVRCCVGGKGPRNGG